MSLPSHHVVIGNGVAGCAAAVKLRELDPKSQVTIVSGGALLFYNRYDLPNVFRGQHQWVDFLVHPPAFYEENRINVRRKTFVTEVDAANRQIYLDHREVISYDKLLVATGGAGYLPERLLENRDLMLGFNNFRVAMQVHEALPDGGHVIMLGGDTLGLDLARTLVGTGHRVTLVAGERTFWPHVVADDDMDKYLAAVEALGITVVNGSHAQEIRGRTRGQPARTVLLGDGRKIEGDVVMPFYGLSPMVDFMSSSGVDLERGILVDKGLKTTNDWIWASGDVCQIWSDETKGYRFYYGWRNVKKMGETAAHNMTGGNAEFSSDVDETLNVDGEGRLHSPFWEHD